MSASSRLPWNAPSVFRSCCPFLAVLGCLSPAPTSQRTAVAQRAPRASSVVASSQASSIPVADTSASFPLLSASSPFSPILTSEGVPTTTQFLVSPVLGATLFIREGYPSWRIGRLSGGSISWDAMPTTGLPEATAWDSLLGRFPDGLWMRVGNSVGGLDWYLWAPNSRSWSLDKKLRQGRRTDVQLSSWTAGKLLAAFVEPESVLGEPARTTLWVLPGRSAPALPRLPRGDASAVATTPLGDLFAAFGSPVEVMLVRQGHQSLERFALQGNSETAVRSLLARSAEEAYLVANQGQTDVAWRFDGTRWSPLELPGSQVVFSLVATADSTLWLLDDRSTVWRRRLGAVWQAVPLPVGVKALKLIVASEGNQLWVGMSSGEPGSWLTLGEVREKTGIASGSNSTSGLETPR